MTRRRNTPISHQIAPESKIIPNSTQPTGEGSACVRNDLNDEFAQSWIMGGATTEPLTAERINEILDSWMERYDKD